MAETTIPQQLTIWEIGQQKTCPKCQQIKPTDDFYKKATYCKNCERAYRSLKRKASVSDPSQSKLCGQCQTEKPCTDFCSNGRCKSCMSVYNKTRLAKYRAENPPKKSSGCFQKGHAMSDDSRLKHRNGIKNSWTAERKQVMRERMIGNTPWNKGLPIWPGGNRGEPRRGEKHHYWKGGITPQNVVIRTSPEYKKWRKAVFARDNYTCTECGARNQDGQGYTVVLNADHIKSFAEYPELRFEISNGRTLCLDCHKRTPNYCGRGRSKNP